MPEHSSSAPDAGGAETPAGSDGTKKTQAESQPAPSAAGNDDLSKIKGKATAYGRSQMKRELLERWGLSSLEEADAVFADIAKAREQAEKEKLAEQAEKAELAEKLLAAQREAKEMAAYRERYEKAAAAMLQERLRNAALAAGVLPEAVDLVELAARPRVELTDDLGLRVRALEGDDELEGLDKLMAQLREKKPFLFRPDDRQGSGILGGSPTPKGRRPKAPKPLSFEDAAKWGRE